MKIPILSVLSRYARVFFQYSGWNLLLLIISFILTGVIESIGITAVIPLINVTSDISQETGKLIYFKELFVFFGLELSIGNIVFFIFTIFLFKTIFIILQGYLQSYIITKLDTDIKTSLVKHYSEVKYEYFVHTKIGNIINSISVEAARFMGAFRKYISFIATFVTMLIYCVFSLFINFSFTIYIFIIGFFVYFSSSKIRRIQVYLSKLTTQYNNQSENLFVQFAMNYKYLKATAQADCVVGKINTIFQLRRLVTFKSYMWDWVTNAIIQLFFIGILLGAFYYLISIWDQSFAEVVVPLIFVHKIFTSLTSLQTYWQKFLSLSGSVWEVDRTKKVLEKNIEKVEGKKIEKLKHSIKLLDVGFSYENKSILEGITLEIPLNSSVGFAGGSGAGKTTLLDLITGLVPYTSGAVLYDNEDYKEIDKQLIRDKFGYITQEPVIFNDTIANNISLWKFDSQDIKCLRKIEDAVKNAYCKEFIKKTDHGLDEVIGEKGARLSGGQRQRICIARELYRNREILIFDEATASLDSESERIIQQSIKEIAGKKTIIIVAHRLSTLRFCDKIYVLDKGRIIESGSWDELLDDKYSLFNKMVSQQSS